MNFNNIKMQMKLLILVGVTSVITAFIAFFGVTNFNHLADTLVEVDQVGSTAAVGARMTQDVIMSNRSEYRIAASPTDETIREAQAINDEASKRFLERVEQTSKVANDDEKALLAKAKQAYTDYAAGLQDVYAVAHDVKNTAHLDGEQQRLYQAVTANRDRANKLTEAVKAYGQAIDKRGTETAQKAVADSKKISMIMVSVAVGGVLAGLIVGWLMATFGIAKPLARSVDQLRGLADGRLDVEVTGADRHDECGDIAKGLAIFKENALKARELEATAIELKQRAEAERRQGMLDLANDFEKSVGGIVTMVSGAATELQAAAQQLTSTAQEASAQSMAVSAAAEEAGANVASVAASTEEMGASVSEIGRQVETSAQISQTAMAEAAEAGRIVEELTEAAESIGGFVDMISGLASQTNLLALNATIESARAGEAGKGFAVVASEVKALAGQTAKATTEISEKIAQIQAATARALTAMQNIGSTINNINSTSTAIASAVEQQSSATQEIVHAVNQASIGTTEVTANITGVADAAEQTGSAAAQVLSSSGELAEQAARLHHEMDQFLANVRAA
ncbi:methyl-accepting chemotaxis protein [Asticcacaulis endophyticus]|uniref:Methyl-accepting chemotaxis protein n=1 Tax=Asticcacaulis endophyticus TaxID=1395890 RepID=A0A918Q3U1_9CAUL|nr:methyl-accepting chemotaxis protein [Asticcacaulis endophyticus]GGZ32818.1 methyl-accepting chemotaxis protein [Asticcacaulis endophyticus]